MAGAERGGRPAIRLWHYSPYRSGGLNQAKEPLIATDPTPDDVLGPVDLFVIGFPGGVPTPAGFVALLELVDSGTVRVLDMEFVTREADGTRIVAPGELPAVEGFDPELWAGASSSLLDEEDLELIAADIEIGELAVVFLIEQQWALGLVEAWTRGGARLIADGGVPAQALIEALDAAENR